MKPYATKRKRRLVRVALALSYVEGALLELRSKPGNLHSMHREFSSLYYLSRLARKAP